MSKRAPTAAPEGAAAAAGLKGAALRQRADALRIPGRSKMKADQLRAAIAAHSKSAPPTAAQAAVAELDPVPKVVTFRDTTLVLPDELPSTLLFDLVELEHATNLLPLYRLLRSLLGSEQVQIVRSQIEAAETAVEVHGAVSDLMGDIFAHYGMSLGG